MPIAQSALHAQAPANSIRQPAARPANQQGTPSNSMRTVPVAAQGQPNANNNQAQQQQVQQQQTQPGATGQQGSNGALGNQAMNGGANPPAGGVPAAVLAQPPFPPLAPAEQDYLNRILAAWEKSTSEIQQFKCDFNRWQYDLAKVTNPEEPYTVGKGVVRYMSPDKGMFKVDEIKFRKQGGDGKYTYEPIQNNFGEYWICDGDNVHLYDRTQKVAKIYQLPTEMKGKQVFNSPLPFLFGVEAQKMAQRYWLRPLPHPVDKNGQPNTKVIVLEAYPKTQNDAQNYHHVIVYLENDESTKTHLMPLAIIICLPEWTESSPNREVFEFASREKNATILQKINEALFRQEFIPKEPPKDWKVEVQPFVDEQPPQRVANPGQPNQLGQPGPR